MLLKPETKLVVLQAFVKNLRLEAEPRCWLMANALERVLVTGSEVEIEEAFEWCESKYGD